MKTLKYYNHIVMIKNLQKYYNNKEIVMIKKFKNRN